MPPTITPSTLERFEAIAAAGVALAKTLGLPTLEIDQYIQSSVNIYKQLRLAGVGAGTVDASALSDQQILDALRGESIALQARADALLAKYRAAADADVSGTPADTEGA